MISQELLPEPLIAQCLDVLRILSANERDLIRVVVEVIHDLRDTNDSDDDFPVRILWIRLSRGRLIFTTG
jgi:condensin complex subunit 3